MIFSISSIRLDETAKVDKVDNAPASNLGCRYIVQSGGFQPSSVIESMDIRSGSLDWIQSIFSKILQSVRSFFSSFCCVQSGRISNSKIDEICHSKNESVNGKFYNIIFDAKGRVRRKESFVFLQDLFKFLGDTSIFGWFIHPAWLKKQIDQLDNLVIHPLECLYYILSSEDLTISVNKLKNKLGVKKLDDELWDLFIDRLAFSFKSNEFAAKRGVKYDQDRVPVYACAPLLPEFCKMLELDLNSLKKHSQNGEWKKFINEAFNQRVAKFKS